MNDVLINALGRATDELINGLFDYVQERNGDVALPNHPQMSLEDGYPQKTWYDRLYIQDGTLKIAYRWVDTNLDGQYDPEDVDTAEDDVDTYSMEEIYKIMCLCS